MFTHELARMRTKYAQLGRLDIFEMYSVTNVREYLLSCSNSAISLSYFQEKNADIFGKGKAMLKGFADLVSTSSPATSLDTLGGPALIPSQWFAELQSFVYNMFPRANELEAESAGQYCNPIFNHGVKKAERAPRDENVSLNTFTNKLVTGQMNDNRGCVWSGMRQAALDFMLGWAVMLIQVLEED